MLNETSSHSFAKENKQFVIFSDEDMGSKYFIEVWRYRKWA